MSRALAAQFVLLKVVTEDPRIWTNWTRKYRSEGSGIPKVYVVRADGKQIYGKSGAPRALPQFLASALRESGRIPSRVELKRFARDVKTVQRAIKDGAIQKAVTVLSRSRNAGTFAAAAIALRKLKATVVDQGKAALAATDKKIKDPKTAFDGLLALVAVERNYRPLRELRKPIAAAMRTVRKDAALRDLLEQAKLVDRAGKHESEKKLKQALSAWQLVLSKYPKTPSAKRAAERIAAIEKQGVTAALAKSKTTSTKSVTSRDEKRAASQLRLGKLLLKRNPAKAKQYFERAIKLAPNSKTAAEAERLLRAL